MLKQPAHVANNPTTYVAVETKQKNYLNSFLKGEAKKNFAQ